MKFFAVIALLALLYTIAQPIMGPLWTVGLCAAVVVIGGLIRLGTYEIPMPAPYHCPCDECKEKR